MSNSLTGAAIVGGVCGQPIKHSMSPVIHNAWIAAAGLDAAYVPFAPTANRFETFVDGLRGGVVRGVNVTIPFKERALAVADTASDLARMAGAANLLLFDAEGRVHADNTDGPGLLGAIAIQAPGFDVTAAPVVILGAGGAARGAVAALLLAILAALTCRGWLASGPQPISAPAPAPRAVLSPSPAEVVHG